MRALVLGGGGARGSWQCGVLKYRLGIMEQRYDIICGTSVGALNGAFLAQFGHNREVEASRRLEDLWRGIDDRKVWRKWYWGALGILPLALPRWLGGKLSAYSSAPLRRLIESQLSPKDIAASGKLLRVGAVDLITGNRRVWTERDSAEIKKAVLASSSFPVMLEPVKIGHGLYTDDGVRDVTPIENAILAGASEIDAVVCSQAGAGRGHPTNGLEVAARCLSAMGDEIERNDLSVTDLYNALAATGAADGKKVVRLNVIRPSAPLVGTGLDFHPFKVRLNIERGWHDAQQHDW